MTSVELVHWPEEEARRAALAAGNRPRLLLVAPGAPAPVTADPAEDWVRLPSDHRDVQARVEALRHRTISEPNLDDDDVLRVGAEWISLPAVEARIVRAMLGRFGLVTDRRSITGAGWPDGEPSRNLLDVHLHRLRRRLAPVGLRIRTVRKRGYVLELGEPDRRPAERSGEQPSG